MKKILCMLLTATLLLTAENGSYQRRGYVYLTLDPPPAEE